MEVEMITEFERTLKSGKVLRMVLLTNTCPAKFQELNKIYLLS